MDFECYLKSSKRAVPKILPQIVGLITNVEFLKSLCEHGHFKKGDVHTDFIKVCEVIFICLCFYIFESKS